MENEPWDRTLVRLGFFWVLAWGGLGLLLESMLGFKWGPVVDDELARSLLRLGHAHGVGIGLLCVLTGYGSPRLTQHVALVRRLQTAAAVLIPSGFALSAIAHPESDPGLPIWLVPLGAAILLTSLGLLVTGSPSQKPEDG